MSGVPRGKFWTAPLAAALLLLAGSGVPPPQLGADPPGRHPAPSATAPGPQHATGTIVGTLELDRRPPRRAARRYTASAPPQTVQPLPAVVYLRGTVAGPGSRTREARGLSMVQRDSTFIPGALAVPVGTTVDFPNEDPVFHNVFSYSSAKRFDLGRYPRGESRAVTFDQPGVVRIFCEVHEHMRAAVVVTEHSFHEVVDDEGRFRLEGVPPGRHTLVAWHADLGEVERTVDVRAGEAVTLALTLSPGR